MSTGQLPSSAPTAPTALLLLFVALSSVDSFLYRSKYIVLTDLVASVKVQPRCGGHSFGDFSIGGQDGSLVVDLTKFQKYEIDEKTWNAKVGGGTLLGELTKRMHNSGGRAMSHGTCPQVSPRRWSL